jgi:hypothetical protein
MLNWLVGYSGMTQATHYITTSYGDLQTTGTENLSLLTGYPNRVNLTAAFASGASSSATANTAIITFFLSAISAGTVDHLAVFDSPVSGNLLATCPISSLYIGIGDGLSIASGACVFSIF